MKMAVIPAMANCISRSSFVFGAYSNKLKNRRCQKTGSSTCLSIGSRFAFESQGPYFVTPVGNLRPLTNRETSSTPEDSPFRPRLLHVDLYLAPKNGKVVEKGISAKCRKPTAYKH